MDSGGWDLDANRNGRVGEGGFFSRHWHGKYSLGRSYWVHGFLLSLAVNVVVILAEAPMEAMSLRSAALTSLLIIPAIAILGVWQLVGIWRSASNSVMKTGRSFWPSVAKFAVVLGFLTLLNPLTAMADIASLLLALEDPDLADYEIERIENTDIVFTGAVNDKSVDEILANLADPDIEILRVNSHGGLNDPALRLARYIRQNEVVVMADGQCASACVLLLAASPSAAIYPGTPVTFHRPQPVVEFQNAELRRENDLALRQAASHYREFGIADWAIERAESQEFWTPTTRELIDMGVLVFIYHPTDQRFVWAETYCSENPVDCDG